jgi:hypothetical protein
MISDEVVNEIYDFSKKYGAGPPIIEEYKITIPLMNISFRFYQQERYDKLISCYFDYNEDVGFFFERILIAVNETTGRHQVDNNVVVAAGDVLRRNDEYVHRVLEFCKSNIDILTVVRPPWFQRAVQVSDAAIRGRFPELADAYLVKAQELYNSWQSHDR